MQLNSILSGALLGLWLLPGARASQEPVSGPSVQITVVPREQHLEVLYRLSTPVVALPLKSPAFPFRGETWQLISEPDLILTKGEVRSISNTSFQQFAIRILPDQQIDRSGLISVVRVEPHGFVFSYHELMPDDDSMQTRLCVKDQPGVCDFDTDETPYFQIKASGMVDEFALRGGGGLLYVGPKEFSSLADVQRVIDDRLPDWLIKRQADYIDRLLAYYGDELYFELSDPMVQVISWHPEAEDAGWSAHVYRNKESVLMFLGDLPKQEDDKIWNAIDYRLAEQVAVLFLSDYVIEAAGVEMKWFYLEVVPVLADEAWQAVGDRNRSREGWRRRVASVCMERLSTAAQDKPRSCGTMVHLFADAFVQKETNGEASYIDLLRRALDIRRSEGISFKAAYMNVIGDYDKDGHIADLVAAIEANDAAFPAILANTFKYLRQESDNGEG